MKKLSFNNTRYKDEGHLVNEDTFQAMPKGEERIELGALGLDRDDGDNYLYNDTHADRFNSSPSDPSQRHGQPRGYDPVSKEPVTDFDNGITADKANKFFVDDLISSFNNEDKLVDDIKQNTGGI
jgi:hypothetical protein